MRQLRCLIAVCAGSAIACESPTLSDPRLARRMSADQTAGWNPVVHTVTGEGSFDLSAAGRGPAQFTITVQQRADGSSRGSFWQYREHEGLTVEFTGQVTCLAFDPVNHRAWVGGIILENRSTDPAARVDTLHTPGMDIWFRVVDYGEGSKKSEDRSTVFGFKWSAGIITSAEYCAVRPWPMTPVPDARTFPVTVGNVQVK
ncbi:MAG: hypothetical protein ACREL9_04395 [Gemmatimonadales bacterium]